MTTPEEHVRYLATGMHECASDCPLPPPGGWKTPGDPSIDGTDFDWSDETAPRAEGLQVTTRGNLAQALLATEMIDRLLDYAKTGEDRQQVAWSWANRIGDWLDETNGSWAAPRAEGLPHPECVEAYHGELLLSGRTIMSVARVRADVAAAEAAQGAAPPPLTVEQWERENAATWAAPRSEGLDATEIAAMALHRWKHPSFDLGEYRCRCRDDAEMAVRLLSRPSDEREEDR